jgi:hypothetical protein
VDNVKMNPGEIGWGDMVRIDLAKDMDIWRTSVNTVMELRVP